MVERDAAELGSEAEVGVGSGVINGLVDVGPKRESDRRVRISPNDELEGIDDEEESKGVLSGAGNVSCLVTVEFVNCRLM